MKLEPRAVRFQYDEIYAEAGRELPQPVHRVAAIAIVENELAGRYVEDLSPLFDVGLELGERLTPKLVELLAGPVLSYGKAAVVGLAGEREHGAAILHPKLGKPLRAAIGGGEAIISSNVKIGPPGTTIDVPLAHKDQIWSFDQLDTLTVSMADAPLPTEIMVVIALADHGRPLARVGSGRAVV
jgi:Amino acid synthesis